MALMLMPHMVFAEEPGNFDELKGVLNNPDEYGVVTLGKDYTIDSTLLVDGTLTTLQTVILDLNGHVIQKTGDGSVFQIGYSASKGSGVYVEQNGTFTMTGGTIAPINGEIYNCNNCCIFANGGTITILLTQMDRLRTLQKTVNALSFRARLETAVISVVASTTAILLMTGAR